MRRLCLGFALLLASPTILAAPSEQWSMGPGWRLLTVDSAGQFTTTLMLDAAGGAVAGIRIYDSNWTFIGGGTGIRTDGGTWAAVATPADPSVASFRLLSTAGSGIVESTLVKSGKFHVLAFLSAEHATVDGEIAGASGSEVTTTASGVGSYYEVGEGGEANAAARVQLATSRAVVDLGAKVTLNVNGGLIGLIGRRPPLIGQEVTTLTGPHGSTTCPCVINAFPGHGGLGPGEYVVTRDAVKVEPEFAEPWIAVIDIG